jgi:hypothetical protein
MILPDWHHLLAWKSLASSFNFRNREIEMDQASFVPSWQIRFLDRLNSARIPPYIVYIMFFLTASLLTHLGPWVEGTLPWGQVDPNQFNFLVWYLFIFFSFDYIRGYAISIVPRFKQVIDVSEEEYEEMSYRLTSIPASAGWVVTVIALVFSVLAYQVMFPWEYAQGGLAWMLTTLVSAFLLSFAFSLIYLIFNQEVMISRLYALVKGINIFRLRSLYVFSLITSRNAIISISAGVLAYLTNVVFTVGGPQFTNFLFFGITFFSLALASFFLPALKIHARLEQEKANAKDENDKRIHRVFRTLHAHVDGVETTMLADLKDQLNTLLTFQTEIKKISTWPWNPETLRGFLSALLVPVALGLIQSLLSKFITF